MLDTECIDGDTETRPIVLADQCKTFFSLYPNTTVALDNLQKHWLGNDLRQSSQCNQISLVRERTPCKSAPLLGEPGTTRSLSLNSTGNRAQLVLKIITASEIDFPVTRHVDRGCDASHCLAMSLLSTSDGQTYEAENPHVSLDHFKISHSSGARYASDSLS